MLHFMEPVSLYIHIPFCRHRCGYCDFNTYAGQNDAISAYVNALCLEIVGAAAASGMKIPVHTLFLGGGTPSLLPAAAHWQILDTSRRSFTILPGSELTLEANPGTVSQFYLDDLHRAGYTRISFGMQSASPEMLRLLERQHSVMDVIDAVKWSRQAGFAEINLDLIFGLPHQTLRQWQETLDFALGLSPEHLSLYALTVEMGTPLYDWVRRGLVSDPDPDLAADMYEWAMERLGGAGFFQYEISNWARQSATGNLMACRHNLQYWRNRPYLGFGAGAHGFISGYRTANVLPITEYIYKIQNSAWEFFPFSPARASTTVIDRETEMQETMMVGLRLVEEGVAASKFQERFGQTLGEVFGREIDDLIKLRLLEWSEDRLRLTQRGRLLGNRVFMRFVGDGESA
jgi:oxygen-independent coproporphyrinogen-3 oxidase